ncbi:MAG TPA: ThuA domain-containing protein [Planctomycetaceae bacterium]|nr:ThuA domain-containing protein [Planctomycetaceae bacterium]
MFGSAVDRRQALQSLLAGAAVAAQAGSALAERKSEKRILFFTKSSGFEHPVVRRRGSQLGFAEKALIELGKKHGFHVEATKDGRVFDGDLDQYDAFAFYTTGNLTQAGTDKQPPMSPKGKEAFLQAIQNGKGFIGFHCASDTFHSPGDRAQNQPLEKRDPYIAMVGGEFIRHGRQQKATMRVVDLRFPGVEKAGSQFEMFEEWYALKNFAPDMHVILVEETDGMVGADYQRPPYPSTWARLHGKGRVFYTAMGHREDVWTNEIFQSIVAGALKWITGQVDADVSANLEKAAPQASVLRS